MGWLFHNLEVVRVNDKGIQLSQMLRNTRNVHIYVAEPALLSKIPKEVQKFQH